MGFFKTIFGSSSVPSDDPLLAVDPETGFEHAWDDEERLRHCTKALKIVKASLGGELRKTEDELRLYTNWNERPIIVEADWYTGDLVITIVGKNRLGALGILRDESLDEDAAALADAELEEWPDDTAMAGSQKEYVSDGLYLETTPDEMKYELERLAALPTELRKRLYEQMQQERLQSLFMHDDGVHLTWERSFFRITDLVTVLPDLFELSQTVFKICIDNDDPDPASASVQRCSFCHMKVLDTRRAKCGHCGGLL